jgi:hypothetical protein
MANWRSSTLLTLILATSISNAFAAEWYLMDTGTAKSLWFFDKATVEKSKPTVRLWIKSVRMREADADGAWATTRRAEYNCQTRTVRTLALVDYDNNENVLKTYNVKGSAVDDIVPGSAAEGALEMVCGPTFPNTKNSKAIQNDPVLTTRFITNKEDEAAVPK